MLQFTVIGNLGNDAEIKDFNGRLAIVFNVAHTERWTNEKGVTSETTTWVSCIWNSDGGNLLAYLKKGTMVYCQGSGSTRVYSSPKERAYVAGLNLRVSHIELVGGRIDTVPKQLVDKSGLLHNVFKHYFINPNGLEFKGQEFLTLYDKKMNAYRVAPSGFITIPADTSETPETTGTSESKETEEYTSF